MNKKINEKIQEVIERVLSMPPAKWVQTWTSLEPMNAVHKNPWTGFNWLLAKLAFDMPLFLTVNQCKKMKLSFKGLKAWPVVYWSIIEVEDKHRNNQLTKVPFQKISYCFNLKELAEINDGLSLDDYITVNSDKPILVFDALLAKLSLKTKSGTKASYSPKSDVITMPDMLLFQDAAAYYRTMFHELIHWTGNKKRLNRFDNNCTSMMNVSYAQEELVAELGSIQLMHHFGYDPSEEQLAYLYNWFRRLKDDGKSLFDAATKAQKAVTYILADVEKKEEEQAPGDTRMRSLPTV